MGDVIRLDISMFEIETIQDKKTDLFTTTVKNAMLGTFQATDKEMESRFRALIQPYEQLRKISRLLTIFKFGKFCCCASRDFILLGIVRHNIMW